MGGQIKAVFVGIIVIFICLMFIVEVTPMIETGVTSANISNPTTSMLIDMLVWVVPVLAIVGVIMAGFAMFKLRGKGGG